MDLKVKDLLSGNINTSFNDKVFWYASKLTISNLCIEIYVDNSNLVCFDDVVLNIQKISQLTSVTQLDNNEMQNVLVSSGSFLFINDKLAVTQRQSTTKFDPSFWTTPAGRCDRSIFETAIKETIEEIEIKHNNKKLIPLIAQNLLDNNQQEYEYYETSYISKKFNIKLYDVNLYLDNELIEQCKSWAYYSQNVNTMEFRIPIFTKLDEKNLSFINPEFFTSTGLKSIKELKKLDCVPALAQLIEELCQS